MKTLTARQRQIYDFINERIRSCGYAPTIREIGLHFAIRSTNGVADHLKALRQKGVLDHQAGKSRTLRLLPLTPAATPERSRRGSRPQSTVRIPLLGRVAAGVPLLAAEQVEQSLEVDRALLPARGEHFALRVVGNSMVEAGILDGDTLFVKKTTQASRGAIVVVTIDDEATVKRYFPESDRLVLRAANRDFADLVIPASAAREVRLVGLVSGVFRRVAGP